MLFKHVTVHIHLQTGYPSSLCNALCHVIEEWAHWPHWWVHVPLKSSSITSLPFASTTLCDCKQCLHCKLPHLSNDEDWRKWKLHNVQTWWTFISVFSEIIGWIQIIEDCNAFVLARVLAIIIDSTCVIIVIGLWNVPRLFLRKDIYIFCDSCHLNDFLCTPSSGEPLSVQAQCEFCPTGDCGLSTKLRLQIRFVI